MTHSEQIGEVAAAILAVQKRLKPLARNATRQDGVSFTDLEAVLSALRKAGIMRHGLTVTQGLDDMNYMTTLVVHAKSGQWIKSCFRFHSKIDRDDQSAAFTQARRYGLMGLFGMVQERETPQSVGAHVMAYEGPWTPDQVASFVEHCRALELSNGQTTVLMRQHPDHATAMRDAETLAKARQ